MAICRVTGLLALSVAFCGGCAPDAGGPDRSDALQKPAGRTGESVEPRREAAESTKLPGAFDAMAGDPERTGISLTSTGQQGQHDGLPRTDRKDVEMAQRADRAADTRARPDERRLAALGIKRYESRRLCLYTDIDPAQAQRLPELIDQAFDAWTQYFGELPAAQDGSEFQITGYLIGDRSRFDAAGVIPADLPPFVNGRHRGAEFWMNDVDADYYRRHLLIHEATHCYMTLLVPAETPQRPPWYMEGMAELFATHRQNSDGSVTFRVFPEQEQGYEDLGRIRLLQSLAETDRLLSIEDILRIPADKFLKTECYAWAWALCWFLDQIPETRESFAGMAVQTTPRGFQNCLNSLTAEAAERVRLNWFVFVRHIRPGFDFDRARIVFRPAEAGSEPGTLQIRTDRGWQHSGMRLVKDRSYRITAQGRFRLSSSPRAWVSEPQGISIRYVNKRRMGELQAAVVDPKDPRSILQEIPIGRSREFASPRDGQLFLRINDTWNSWGDNKGTVTVRMEPSAGGS